MGLMSENGLLWFCDDANRSLLDKIERGARRHLAKLHKAPTVCIVNADQLAQAKREAESERVAEGEDEDRPDDALRGFYDVVAVENVGDVRVVASKSTAVNCFWLGVPAEQAKDSAKA